MLYRMLSSSRDRFPETPAVIVQNRTVTYRELQRLVDCFAGQLLVSGVKPSDRVVLFLPNGLEFVVSVFAIAKIGAIAVPLNPLYQEKELSFYLHDCQPRTFLTTPILQPMCERLVAALNLKCQLFTSLDVSGFEQHGTSGVGDLVSGEVLYQYSSGSTGIPKRVGRSQVNLVEEAGNFVSTVGLENGDRILTVVPLFHAHGFGNCLLATVHAGATMVIQETFNRQRVFEALLHEHITVFPGVPFMFGILADSPSIPGARMPWLTLAFSAGAPLPYETFEKFYSKFGVTVRQLYGSTEMGSAAINLGSCIGELWASVGLPMQNVDIRVADADGRPIGPNQVGEILVKSPAMTAGYAGLDAVNRETFRDGYFWSGDLGKKDEQGNIFITGRKKLFINAAGYKVDPLEVEELLNTHPQIAESVVVGVKGRHGQEMIKAVVVATGPCTTEGLQNWCRGKIADFKIPRIVEFREEIPKSPLGKILRKYLQDAM